MVKPANIEKKLGKYFVIRSKSQPDLVLEVSKASLQNGAQIVLTSSDVNIHHYDIQNHQLWFWEKKTNTIRSKLNNYCLSAHENGSVLSLLYTASENQHWELKLDKYITLKDTDTIVSVKQHTLFAGAQVTLLANEGLKEQQWILSYIPSELFFIHHKASGRVVDIRGDNASPGTQLITYAKKETMYDNQLWWEDQYGGLHSKMHDFVIRAYDNDVGAYPYDSTDHQQWVLNGYIIQNFNNPDMVLDVKPATRLSAFSNIIPNRFNTTHTSQEWSLEVFRQEPFSIDHDGSGKYFLIKQNFFDLYITIKWSSTYPIPVFFSRLDLTQKGLYKPEQLFFKDPTNNVIRSKLNEKLCLEAIDNNLFLSPFQPGNVAQSIMISDYQNVKEKNVKKIHLKGDELSVLTIGITDDDDIDASTATCYMAEDFKSHHQMWCLDYGRAPLFYIVSKSTDKVLEAKRSADLITCTVSLCDRKVDTRCPYQLWYEDEVGLIRSHINGFVLDTAYGQIHTDRLNRLNQHQGWVISRDQIRNKNTNLVLEVQKKWLGSGLEEAQSNNSESQRWSFLFVC